MANDAQLLKESLTAIEPHAAKVTQYFYARIFVENPDLRAMFPLAMDTQRDRLLSAIIHIVRGIERPDVLFPYLQRLGRGHRRFGVVTDHYHVVGNALIAAVREHSRDVWTDETEGAWIRAYAFAARAMIDAARADEDRPAWWDAEVIAHERRGEGLAVLQVRPDQPYSYQPGQYCHLESPRQPREWRPYSFASAPRPDGVLEFHVRCVDAGWVSRALVRQTRLGDVLRLGPPVGSMVLDRSSRRDLVMAGGGTGLAPLRAMVEEMARGAARRAHLFFGVRRREQLYDLPALRRLADRSPWLTLVVACSDDPTWSGEHGTLPDLLERYGPWAAHDAYASGSPAMLRATVARYRALGVPAERIRHDVFDQV
ncbi:MAG TPA: globin domain-containing protein [Cryptosporangiaceae bacterium]|nr:globin domain-containing protein [Cryptosporangiaceae bacterium]